MYKWKWFALGWLAHLPPGFTQTNPSAHAELLTKCPLFTLHYSFWIEENVICEPVSSLSPCPFSSFKSSTSCISRNQVPGEGPEDSRTLVVRKSKYQCSFSWRWILKYCSKGEKCPEQAAFKYKAGLLSDSTILLSGSSPMYNFYKNPSVIYTDFWQKSHTDQQ